MAYELPGKSAWALSLPESYLHDMGVEIDRLTASWYSENDREQGYEAYMRACFLYGRMDQCMTSVLPWISNAIPNLSELQVLEVGCGNGSATVPLASHSASVRAFDIDEPALKAARRRCDLMGVNNVEIFHRDTSWIDSYLADPRTLGESPPDAIFCYALIEHLTPVERVKFLKAAWADLRVGGHLIVVECPNRLHWFDWHSSMLPFSDSLPDELALLWYGQSDRSSIWANLKPKSVDDLVAVDKSQLYRFGRGVSFHEFAVAIGFNRIRVTAGPFSPSAIGRSGMPGYDAEWQSLLERKLGELTPAIPREFATNCLDLVLTKMS